MDYNEFLKSKVEIAKDDGIDEIESYDINPILKPHQQAVVAWMLKGGRRACFASFGLGKTVIQLEAVRVAVKESQGLGLIVLPLGVRQEFVRDAAMLGIKVKFIRRFEEVEPDIDIYLTNYETVRDGKLDPRKFTVTSLDEASILRGFGGTKTFREFMTLFAGDEKKLNERNRSEGIQYRFVATATPSPNDFIELLAYAAYLGIMDVSQAKTRFFKRDSTKADKLTIHPHKVNEFWLWVSSWGIFLQKPSDLGFDDTGYDLPTMQVKWHEVATDHSTASAERDGQQRLFKNAAVGLGDAAKEKRESIGTRVEHIRQLIANIKEDKNNSEQVIVWCDLNNEQKAMESMLKKAGITFSSLTGTQPLEIREALLEQWRNKETRVFLSKPMMYGAGINLQSANNMIFAGIGFKFYDIFQSIHRIHRFLQVHPCNIHFIYTEAEREIKATLLRKWGQHTEVVNRMTEIIHEYGLSKADMAKALVRGMGVDRIEVTGERFKIINNDCVKETAAMDESSVDFILSSIPFSSQYEYSPNYADFGHSDNNEHFFKQMDFLTPNLLKILKPGRIAAIHVKDRIVPGGMTGLGFQTVYPFHSETIRHFVKHGFGYMGMKTIVTDVVRENNQTYRLGWTEQCKDGSKMGVGMPEYLLIFRKPPTSTENAYADEPVVKNKPDCFDYDDNIVPWKKALSDAKREIAGTGYSRAKWQIDAHGFTRSNGNRPVSIEDFEGLTHADIFKLFKHKMLTEVYDFEQHVKIGEYLDAKGALPVTFMLLQPASPSSEVWSDITRMLTLNGAQSAKGKEMHLCPMQLDIADRCIEQFSMPGEVVFDPFAGIGTVPMRAVKAGRFGMGTELSSSYFLDAAGYCKMAELEVSMPTLFDLMEADSSSNLQQAA